MSADPNIFSKALLWAGIEDYCPLWQAVWEINTLLPDQSEQTRLDVTRRVVRSLLDQGFIGLMWVESNEIQPVELLAAQQLINQPQSWIVRAGNERQICLSTTEPGEKLYRSLS